jgi:hypothetical protein
VDDDEFPIKLGPVSNGEFLIRATLPPARTYGPQTVADAARMIAAHQAGYLQ